MELKLKPYHKNIYPLEGILIKNTSVVYWIKEIQRIALSPEDIQLYPIPGTTANSIWGCLILTSKGFIGKDIGNNEWCQKLASNFFIAERSVLQPEISAEEIQNLFSSSVHVFHPDFGLAELTEQLQIEEMIETPAAISSKITSPQDMVFIPKQVRSFLIKPDSQEEIMKNLEENIFPKKEKLEDEPLNLFEKAKLSFYKLLLEKRNEKGEETVGKTSLLSRIGSLFATITGKKASWIAKIEKDYENLEERNQKQIDKLIHLLKNNPAEALKYAIPLDNEGATRGDSNGHLNLTKRWSDFSLFGRRTTAGSGNISIGDHYSVLHNQYLTTAHTLIKQKEFHQAAFVYLKLLRNPALAAQALEVGNHFQEAATLYLQNGGNKSKAAECYEKGHMIAEAIELYKELKENEKVGDLFVRIGNRPEANFYYEKVVENYIEKEQYVKGSLIYKHKMNDELGGQNLLLKGWRNGRDAFNCLNNYFANIKDSKVLKNEISGIYRNDVSEQNREAFLRVVSHEYKKGNELSDYLKALAYEIVATHIKLNPSIVSELKNFNPHDKELLKDTMRFKMYALKR